MTITGNKIKKKIVIFLLLPLLWANFNVFYFSHLHIDENGKLVVHAHPYQKGDQNQANAANHTHTKNKFILLALIYQALTVFTLSLFIFAFLFNFNLNRKINFSFQWNPAEIFCNNILRRGPPWLEVWTESISGRQIKTSLGF